MRPPRPAANPRRRVLCPQCRTDVAISAAGKLSRHKVVITPHWIRVWCPAGGTTPGIQLQEVPVLQSKTPVSIKQADELDVEHLPFGSCVASPSGKRFIVEPGGVDGQGRDFVLLLPIGSNGLWNHERRRRLRTDQSGGWTIKTESLR